MQQLPLHNTPYIAELSAALKEAEECRDALDRFKDIVKDEIIATKETYFAIHSHCYETEVCMCIGVRIMTTLYMCMSMCVVCLFIYLCMYILVYVLVYMDLLY